MKILSSVRSLYNASSVLALSLAFLLIAASTTYATLTFTGTAATSDGALTLNGAAASNVVIGSATTTGAITVGAATHTGGLDITAGSTTADSIDITNSSLTTGNVIDLVYTGTTGSAIKITDSTGADANAMVWLENTTADVAAQTYLVQGRYTDDGQALADFLLFEDNNGDDMFSIGQGGTTTITGVASGTDALILTAGDILLTSGHLDLTVGDITVTDGRLILTTESGGTCADAAAGLAINLTTIAKGMISVTGDDDSACDISFTNGTQGEVVALSLAYAGANLAFTFADVTGYDAAFDVNSADCTDGAGVTEATADRVYIFGIMNSATELMILSCQYMDADS